MLTPDPNGATPRGRPTRLLSVHVHRCLHGRWEVVLGRGSQGIRCETLAEARRIAYLTAENTGPCELIVHDAYNRVLQHELVDRGQAAPARTATEPQTRR